MWSVRLQSKRAVSLSFLLVSYLSLSVDLQIQFIRKSNLSYRSSSSLVTTLLFSAVLSLCLDRLGPFFSKYTVVHVVNSEEDVLQRLQQHNLSREGLPPTFGGTWSGFDEWLVSEKCTLDRSLHLDALVRNTLWAYSEKVSPSIPSHGTAAARTEAPKNVAEESLLRDRKAFAHFDIRDYTKEQHRELSPDEQEMILRDIYGSTDVRFTITKEIEIEGRARKQFDEYVNVDLKNDRAEKRTIHPCFRFAEP